MTELGKMTRLQLLKRSGAAGLGLVAGGTLLSACGDSGSTTASSVEGLSPAAARKRLASATGTVQVLVYEGLLTGAPPKGVDVEELPMVAVEDPINKKGKYDVGSNVTALFEQQNLAGAMSPMSLELVPNLSSCVSYSGLVDANRTPTFSTLAGTPYGAGYLWAPLLVTYLQGTVKPVESLESLLEPEYRGRFGIGDEPIASIMMVASSIGAGGDEPGRLTPAEFDKVMAKLGEYKEAAKGFIPNPYGEFPSQYGRGEIAAAFPDYNGTVAITQRSGVKVGTSLVPGCYSFAEAYFIGSGGSGTDADYAVINANLTEDAQLKLAELLSCGVFNRKAMDKVGKMFPLFRDPEALLSKAPLREFPPLESDEFVTYSEWSKRWQELKV